MTGRYLITTDGYFFAPDGKQYRAVWGDVQILPDTFLGVQTNRNSSNWFARVGSEEQHVILAGCQIHYAVKVEQCPNTQDVQERVGTENVLQTVDSRIYVPVEADIPEPPKGAPERTGWRADPQAQEIEDARKLYDEDFKTQYQQSPEMDFESGHAIRTGDSDAGNSIRLMLEKIRMMMSASIKNKDQFQDLLSEVRQDMLEKQRTIMFFYRADALHVNIYDASGLLKRQFHFSLP